MLSSEKEWNAYMDEYEAAEFRQCLAYLRGWGFSAADARLASAYVHLTAPELRRVLSFVQAYGMRVTGIRDGVVGEFVLPATSTHDAAVVMVDMQRAVPGLCIAQSGTGLRVCLMRRGPDLNFLSMTDFLRKVRHHGRATSPLTVTRR